MDIEKLKNELPLSCLMLGDELKKANITISPIFKDFNYFVDGLGCYFIPYPVYSVESVKEGAIFIADKTKEIVKKYNSPVSISFIPPYKSNPWIQKDDAYSENINEIILEMLFHYDITIGEKQGRISATFKVIFEEENNDRHN